MLCRGQCKQRAKGVQGAGGSSCGAADQSAQPCNRLRAGRAAGAVRQRSLSLLAGTCGGIGGGRQCSDSGGMAPRAPPLLPLPPPVQLLQLAREAGHRLGQLVAWPGRRGTRWQGAGAGGGGRARRGAVLARCRKGAGGGRGAPGLLGVGRVHRGLCGDGAVRAGGQGGRRRYREQQRARRALTRRPARCAPAPPACLGAAAEGWRSATGASERGCPRRRVLQRAPVRPHVRALWAASRRRLPRQLPACSCCLQRLACLPKVAGGVPGERGAAGQLRFTPQPGLDRAAAGCWPPPPRPFAARSATAAAAGCNRPAC